MTKKLPSLYMATARLIGARALTITSSVGTLDAHAEPDDSRMGRSAVANASIAQGKKAREVDLAQVQEVARKKLGHELDLNAQRFNEALNPSKNGARRTGIGGPTPSSVRAMIAAARSAPPARAVSLRARVDNCGRQPPCLEQVAGSVR